MLESLELAGEMYYISSPSEGSERASRANATNVNDIALNYNTRGVRVFS